MYKLNERKYRNVILFLARKLGKVWGKKKFYKLLYFLDFDFFEKHEKPITGDIYHKLMMGPAPSYFDAIVDELFKEGLLEVSKGRSGPGYNDAYIYKALVEPDTSVFSEEEIKMMNRIIKVYGGKSGTQLEILTHKEAPYLAVGESEEIPLELSHYRGTVFN